MKRTKEHYLSPEVARMGQLMRHIRTSKNISERAILKEMTLTHASYWAMETGLQRQSFADLMRFADATKTCFVTNLIASISGNLDLAIHGADKPIGAWAIEILIKIYRQTDAQISDLNLAAIDAIVEQEVAAQMASMHAAKTVHMQNGSNTSHLRVAGDSKEAAKPSAAPSAPGRLEKPAD
jgi:transcriptional regulator with XRE-family HTH domain